MPYLASSVKLPHVPTLLEPFIGDISTSWYLGHNGGVGRRFRSLTLFWEVLEQGLHDFSNGLGPPLGFRV